MYKRKLGNSNKVKQSGEINKLKNTKKKFDLIENAKDSLAHAVEHFTKSANPTASDLKRAILDVSHVIELILKERVRRIHPAFIWSNIDQYPSTKAQTIGVNKAISRLFNLEKISLSNESKNTLLACRRIRNLIEHYEFEIELKRARIIVGRMLSFIFEFAKLYLDLDLESDFKSDKRWSALIDIFEFWDAHRDATEQRLMKERDDLCECPSCGAITFSLSDMECLFCEHAEEQVECERCKEMVWESDIEIIEEIDGDESGYHHFQIAMCRRCFEKDVEEGLAADAAEAMYREK